MTQQTTEATINRYSSETNQTAMGCANILSLAQVSPGDIILDLGCGSGHQTKMLADLTGASGKAYGLDLTPAMILKAQSLFKQPNLVFIQGDIHQLPFDSGAFDLITSNCVINHSLHKDVVYTEINRVLKKNGRFLIADIMAVKELPAHIKADPEAIAQCYGGAILKKDYLTLLKKIGFIHIQELTSRIYSKNGFLLESIILTGEKQ